MSEKYKELIDRTGARIKEYQEEKKSIKLKNASDFNFLDFFRPGENKISEILSFLLNPKASHGQGDKFLKEFLKACNVSGIGSFKSIRRERPTDKDTFY